ncbi:ice-binding family protein [Undibacterium arcticum]
MNPTTINSSPAGTLLTFTLKQTIAGTDAPGIVAYDAPTKVATFTATSDFAPNTNYTATISTAAKDLAGNALASNKVWTFTTNALPCAPPPVSSNPLGTAATFGTFGGTAGMTNKGIQTLITGSGGRTADIGTIATDTSAITGFQDSALDVYTVVPGVNQGIVTGKIYSCTTSTTGPTNPTNGVNAASCAKATQARLDAQTAYLALAALPVTGTAAANLAGLTLAPNVYKAASGSFLIEGGDLTLDAQGDATAVWVFQMATTLTVGGPGAAAPQSVKLINGALAKNVYWQVGSAAIINAGGGGGMVGTIISQAGAAFSTSGNVAPVTLNGRALSLGASVTLVNTVITVPAP